MYPNRQAYSQGYPQQGMMPYPTMGAPVNVTQCGVPFDQIRNDIINMIVNNANRDNGFRTLTTECMGPNQNWQSGRLDAITERAAVLLDLFTLQHKQPIEQSYPMAIDEAVNCAWAYLISQYNMGTDATVQANIQQINHYIGILNSRGQELNSLNMNTGYSPVQQNLGYNRNMMNPNMGNVRQQQPMVNQRMPGQPMMGNQGYQPGYNQMYQQGQPAYANQSGNWQSTPYNGQNYGVQGYNNQMQRPGINSLYTSGNSTHNQTQTGFTGSSSDATLNRLKQQYQAKAGQKLDHYGFPIEDDDAPATETTQHNPLDSARLRDMNQVPPKQSIMPSLPNNQSNDNGYTASTGRMEISDNKFTGYGVPAMKDNMPGQILHQTTVNSPIQSVDLTDKNVLREHFGEIKRQEVLEQGREKGLLDDEVKTLTMAERDKLLKAGHKLEDGTLAPLAADPNTRHLHLILLTNGKIRQLVSTRGDSTMRLDAATDALEPIRNSAIINASPNVHRNWTTTTLGGVEYDRFKLSKVKLQEGLDLALKHKAKDRQEYIDKAYRAYDKQIKLDLEHAYLNVGKEAVLALEEAEKEGKTLSQSDLNEYYKPAPFDPENEQGQIKKEKLKTEIPIKRHTEAMLPVGLCDIRSILNELALVNNEPVIDDTVEQVMVKHEEIVRVYNTPEEREEAVKLFDKLFFKSTDKPDDESSKNASGLVLWHYINDNKDKYDPAMLTELKVKTTNYVNDLLKYVAGLDWTIDCFLTDYPELMIELDNGGYKDYMAITLDALVGLYIRTFDNSTNVSPNDKQFDMGKQRALIKRYYTNWYKVPTIATAAGICGDVATISVDSHKDIFDVLAKDVTDMISSRINRDKYDKPVVGLFVNFLDGNTYRVYPNFSGKDHPCESTNLYIDRLTLVRVKPII